MYVCGQLQFAPGTSALGQVAVTLSGCKEKGSESRLPLGKLEPLCSSPKAGLSGLILHLPTKKSKNVTCPIA